jgi:hypothetical protein
MTVIATDGIHIAADGRITSGQDIITEDFKKIAIRERKIFAIVGCVPMLNAAMYWFINGHDPKDMPPIGAEESWGMMVIDEHAGRPRLRYVSYKQIYPVELRFPFADGCASQFAMGAMTAGASPEEAVRICMNHSVWIGGKIQMVDIYEALDINRPLQLPNGHAKKSVLATGLSVG